MKHRILPLLLAVGVALGLAACGGDDGDGAADGGPRRATLALDWFAQPSNGGPYAAQDAGYYRDRGIELTIQPGSAQATSIQIVGGGKAQFGLETAENILQARDKGVPIVALAATLQKSPAVLLYHRGQPIRSYRDLNGRTVYTQIGAPVWQYQKKKYGLDDVKDRQFAGSYAPFAKDERAVAQGYVTSSPAQLKAQGVDVDVLENPEGIGYGSVLFTTEREIRDHPDLVRDVVAATVQGWERYRDHDDEVSAVLARNAKGRTVEDLKAEGEAQKPFIWTGDAETHGFGWTTAARWQATADLLLKAGAIGKPADVRKAFTTEFLPQR
ncbi:ABC transporter substrate-binding protein [Patulibacter defluvii]|uniref:ABC transporter substrate-binding protein n=1 Tax=Patulibacter defluvii TaxID=3095358 RepID=UPI002A754BBB|nr:ABC transporter substrate-binding protein [Patulibacter sp. DM4]